MPKWTENQDLAIKDKGHNIIVSAGAGSGKTAVLSQRVLQHIQDGWDINRLLVLTFTNLAAKEMKTRIRKVILKNENGVLTEDRRKDQLNKIDGAYIMTFDAYALALVKKYHIMLNVDSDINIIQGDILGIKQEEILDEIFESRYAKGDPKFLNMVGAFCVKDDSNIRDWVKSIYRSVKKNYDVNSVLDNYSQYFTEQWANTLLSKYKAAILDKLGILKVYRLELKKVCNQQSYFDVLDTIANCKDYEKLKDVINISFPRLNYSDADEETKNKRGKIRDRIKKTIETIKKDLVEDQELIDKYLSTQDTVEAMVSLVKEFYEKLQAYKTSLNLYEYEDIFKMAIKIVKDYPDIQKEMKEYFSEIMVDEYQDNNDLQEMFINYIANDNVYCVGDIKQSIYRFRNANPKIFQSKYDAYKNHQGGELISLLDNFRSRGEVLEDINLIFSRLMDSEVGDAQYNQGHEMSFGLKVYNTLLNWVGKKEKDNNNHLEIISFDYSKKEGYGVDFTRDEIEAFIIAKDIQEKIENGYEVYDVNLEKMRQAKYSDFCILVSVSTNFDMFKQVLTYHQIPSVLIQDETMDNSDLLTVIKSAFKVLDSHCRKDYSGDFKHNFISLARSFVVEMSDEQIHDAITKNAIFETSLMEKINKISKGIESKSSSDILDEIIKEFDIYDKCIKIAEVNNNLVKIDYLYQMAHQLNNLNYSYKQFAEYLNDLFTKVDNKQQPTYSNNEGEVNAVKIMTIHKSKGLEFPVCYYPSFDRQFNEEELKGYVDFNKDLGFVVPEFDRVFGVKRTMIDTVRKNQIQRDMISEQIRLLYVALTRAREKMIVIYPAEDKQVDNSSGVLERAIRLRFKSFADMLNSIYRDLSRLRIEADLDRVGLSKDYTSSSKLELNKINKSNEKIVLKQYSAVASQKISKERFSKDSGLIDKETKAKMDFGTMMHYYLEVLDFVDPDYSVYEEKYRHKLQSFLNNELMKDVAKAKVYKEYEFIYNDDGLQKHGFMDLLLEYDDRFVIIDYKLKNIDDENYQLQLKGYKQYLESISDKKVECYLYSVMDENYQEIV